MKLSKGLMRTRRAAEHGWLLLLLGGLGSGCAGGAAGRRAASASGPTPRETRIVHEDCAVDDSGAVAEDVNGDGRPDRRTVSEAGHVVCRALDFNFDGVIDTWVYLDASGRVRRRESDYDRDGRIDEVAIYKDGVLSERQRATTLAGKLDTWQHYRNGKVASAERDSNGDDYVDQWWEYPDQRSPDCPLIHSDVNGDGRPDPGATVDVCKDQYVPTARDGEKAPGAGDSEPGIGDVPTEVEPGAASPSSSSEPAGETPAAEEKPAAPSEGKKR
jgi:hypothetical protein